MRSDMETNERLAKPERPLTELEQPYKRPLLETAGLSMAFLAITVGSLSSGNAQPEQSYNAEAALQASAANAPELEVFPSGQVEIVDPTEPPSALLPSNKVRVERPAARLSLGQNLNPKATSELATQIPTSETAIPKPEVKPSSEQAKAEKASNPEIEQGIKMAPMKRLIIRNPDGKVLIDVTTEPYSGEYQGKDANGTPQYNMDPPVAQSQGDNRANYIDWAGSPNTLPKATTQGEGKHKLQKQDDNPIVMSHSSNMPGVFLAFQLLPEAKVGATATAYTDNGIFKYELKEQKDLREILKKDVANSNSKGYKFTWDPIKNSLVVITCKAAIGPDGVRVPASQEDNVVARFHLVAAKATGKASK